MVVEVHIIAITCAKRVSDVAPKALKNLLTYTSCRLEDAIKMTSENPARVLGIFSETGSIAVGKLADLVVLNDAYEVKLTVCKGRVVYKTG